MSWLKILLPWPYLHPIFTMQECQTRGFWEAGTALCLTYLGTRLIPEMLQRPAVLVVARDSSILLFYASLVG